LRKKILRQLSQNYINRLVKNQIDDLNNRKEEAEFEIDIYRHKSFQFIASGKCDFEATHTIFGQIYQFIKPHPENFEFFR
jgi:hypothetical protein